ncbi:hypothetical protein TSAR_013539 [Trichomalopsis sarcophagae]|uniref:Uncharacterized protein n=1 Tax=Trichomalopsis sarcophagae TaxID=543379 RepID=A0A232EJA6_9HYME|nr:hypothetical protein TSAR_013539 [Trichomalopsis sarcophagae]
MEASRPLKLNIKDIANYVPEYDGKNMTVADYIKKLKQVRNLIDEVNPTNLLKARMKGEAEEALSGNEIKNIDELINAVKTLYTIDDDIHELIFKMRRIIQG